MYPHTVYIVPSSMLYCWFLDCCVVIATRQTEGNYQQVVGEVNQLISDYNTLLCQSLTGVTPSTA